MNLTPQLTEHDSYMLLLWLSSFFGSSDCFVEFASNFLFNDVRHKHGKKVRSGLFSWHPSLRLSYSSWLLPSNPVSASTLAIRSTNLWKKSTPSYSMGQGTQEAQLIGRVGVPFVRWFKREIDYNAIFMDLLDHLMSPRMQFYFVLFTAGLSAPWILTMCHFL
jgi:hypothetical protein